MGDRDIVQHDVVALASLHEEFLNTIRNLLSLCEQLFGGVLGNDSLQDLIADGRKNTVSVIRTNALVNLEDVRRIGMGQHSECDSSLIS